MADGDRSQGTTGETKTTHAQHRARYLDETDDEVDLLSFDENDQPVLPSKP